MTLSRSAAKAARAPLLRHVGTVPVAIDRVDWAKIIVGDKREFRSSLVGRARVPLDCPRPVLAYNLNTITRDVRARLMICEASWEEPLGAISPASLEAEGFAHIDEFVEYWKMRHPAAGYRALQRIRVHQLRPWKPEDLEHFSTQMFLDLYEPWL